MDRRTFIKTTTGIAALAGSGIKDANAFIPAHNGVGYNFGSGPVVKDRRNQGPFPSYPPEEGEGHTRLFASIPFPDYHRKTGVDRNSASKLNPNTPGCEYPAASESGR